MISWSLFCIAASLSACTVAVKLVVFHSLFLDFMEIGFLEICCRYVINGNILHCFFLCNTFLKTSTVFTLLMFLQKLILPSTLGCYSRFAVAIWPWFCICFFMFTLMRLISLYCHCGLSCAECWCAINKLLTHSVVGILTRCIQEMNTISLCYGITKIIKYNAWIKK